MTPPAARSRVLAGRALAARRRALATRPRALATRPRAARPRAVAPRVRAAAPRALAARPPPTAARALAARCGSAARRWLVACVLLVLVAGCGEPTTVREPTIDVSGTPSASPVPGAPAPDGAVRIAVVTHGPASSKF